MQITPLKKSTLNLMVFLFVIGLAFIVTGVGYDIAGQMSFQDGITNKRLTISCLLLFFGGALEAMAAFVAILSSCLEGV